MKQLESIGLVQFFLYNRIDIDIARNTAFLGPNGTGKTALLDALQIVLLGADRNRIHFNASSEGKRRARSMRDYCLGVFGQRPSDVCRDSANTYVSLVFRDLNTNSVLTAGVSLSAIIDSPGHDFNSLFILPEVALTTSQMVEREGGKEQVLPWRRMQHVFRDLCREAGTTPLFTTNGEQFSRDLFAGHLLSAGESPNPRAIRSAFARSLKLNQDVDDLNDTLRTHLIESKPTNIDQFRARLDQFREIKRTIAQLRERLERAEVVDREYRKVRSAHSRAANYRYLQTVYQSEQIGEELAERAESLDHLEKQHAHLQTSQRRAGQESSAANERLIAAKVALGQDPEYARHAGTRADLQNSKKALEQQRLSLQAELEQVATVARRIAGNQDMADLHGQAAEAVHQVTVLIAMIGRESELQPEDVSVVANALSELYADIDALRIRLAQQVGEAGDAVTLAKSDLDRIGSGRAPLRHEVSTLQVLLANAGIEATPVCDLVEVSDKKWQPAIEAYLGRNVDALLIHDRDRDREAEAIGVFRKNLTQVRGAKMAMPSRGRAWQAQSSRPYAAQLITGNDRAAVWYLQGELGRLELVTSNDQLRNSTKSIGQDGVISSGGGIDSLNLPSSSALRIGGATSEEQRRDVQAALQAAESRLARVKDRLNSIRSIGSGLAVFADVSGARERLIGSIQQITQHHADVVHAQALADAGASGNLVVLEDVVRQAEQEQRDKDEEKTRLTKEDARVEGLLTWTNSELVRLRESQVRATAHESQAKQDPMCDLNAADQLRQTIDVRTSEDAKAAISHCAQLAADSTRKAEAANAAAWGEMRGYLADFLRNNQELKHEISAENWQKAHATIQGEIKRMTELELIEKEDDAKRAYDEAVKVFRSDVAYTLLNGFDAIEEQIKGLNRVLDKAPEFTNGERYRFRATKVEQHRALYDFLLRVREMGDDETNLFGGSGPVPEEFRLLVEGDGKGSPLQLENSPLNDHRLFFHYDVDILAGGEQKGKLSKRFGPGSGGEHRTPLYVIFGAALAAAFGKAPATPGCGGLILLDEAFEKMDAQNVRATAEYLNALGLQMIIAGPESDQAKMSSFLDLYWDMARFGSRRIQLTRTEVKPAARELLASDIVSEHPELMAQALAEIEAQGHA